MERFFITILALSLSSSLYAQREEKVVKPAQLRAISLGILGVSGESNAEPVLGGRLDADFPLATTSARMYGRVTLTALPGPADPEETLRLEAFARVVEISVGGYLPISGNTSFFADFTFASALENKPVQRYPRRTSAGVMFSSEKGRVQLGLGHDDAAKLEGDPITSNPFDQLVLSFEVNLTKDGFVVFGGDSTLNLVKSTDSLNPIGRDITRVYVGVNLNRIFK